MRVLVTGSRSFPDPQIVFDALDAVAPDLVIHGACPTGADAFAAAWCLATGTPEDPHPADWTSFGKRAGFLRNRDMVSLRPDLVLAFPHGESRGTRMTMNLAREAGLEIREITVP